MRLIKRIVFIFLILITITANSYAWIYKEVEVYNANRSKSKIKVNVFTDKVAKIKQSGKWEDLTDNAKRGYQHRYEMKKKMDAKRKKQKR
jgi:hypothetical protein